MSATASVLKQRVSKILRRKVKEGMSQELADLIKKDLFKVLTDDDFLKISSVLLAALLDREVSEFGYG
jgi:hypothetical protein